MYVLAIAGFDAARGDYVLFLNNDTEVKPRWLDELYETMERDPKIGVVGSKLLFPDGSLQEVGGLVWRLGDAWNWGRGQAADDPRFCYMRDADYVSGAALMVRASLFAAAGKFDELYAPAYYEDNDLCFQARQLGYRVVVQPASEVVHFEGQSAGTSVTGTGMKRFQAINHRKFLERWKETLASHRYNGEFPELEAERRVRQRALFIDDSVPEPDKDAGSNAAFQHMLSLQRLGYKVTFIPGDNMARIDPYTRDLQRRGIECLYHPYFVSVEDVFRKNQFPVDLVYLHRYSNASKYAGMVRQHFPKARIVYNVADLHFLRMRRQAELQGDAALRENAEHLRRLEVGAMSFVDCVIVHSNVEAELLREVAPHIEVRVIPWTVEPRGINAAASWPPSIAFIGGYRHPPNVDAARWAVNSVMPLLRSKISGIELLLVGSNMPSEVNALAARDMVPLGYVPSLDTVFERVRLTVSPLRYGAGLKGKVLESLAAGVPCVMTKISAEGLELPPELEWLVVDEPELLADRVETLCVDDDRHRRIVEACRSYVAAHYSADRIDTQLREACGSWNELRVKTPRHRKQRARRRFSALCSGAIHMKILVVFGTRPEAIKMAPVVKALAGCDTIKPVVCLTGQHHELLAGILAFFGLKADHDLAIMKPGQDLVYITTAVLSGVQRVLADEQPDWLLVHGDTTTAMAAALAGFYAGCRIGHVEAGYAGPAICGALGQREMNRSLVDRVADVALVRADQRCPR